MQSLQDVGKTICDLQKQVDLLAREANPLGITPIEQSEWYQLMTQKLLPQLTDQSYLVVAVVGGTNIGKSVVFNHLCGEQVSATSPLASGTKHPTCLVPDRFATEQALQEIFSEFELRQVLQPSDALQFSETDLLFWKQSSRSPANLLLLDTPDIDSDAEVNWARADKIRRSADVLITVLTQQKYNDAAVKRFFRAAAEEDKSIVVIFNQLLLPEDDEYWPIWLKTFCEETGIDPEYVYVAPHDRRAAESNQLAFYQREWPTEPNEVQHDDQARNLMQDLSQLRFDEIKLKSLSGALATLKDHESGIPSFLENIRSQARIHADAQERLTSRMQDLAVSWPVLPNRIVIQEIRNWWKENRTGWQASVHGFYDTIGHGLMWPIRQFQSSDENEEPAWLTSYRNEEWRTIQIQLSAIYDRLEALADHGHPVLAPRLKKLVAGQTRQQTIARLKAAHQESGFDRELQALVRVQMTHFRDERKDWYQMFKRLDSFAAAARPAVTVGLFATGFGPVGNAVMPVMTDTALQAALHFAGDITAGTVTAAVGEQALSSGTSTGMRFLEAWFHQFHHSFVEIRKNWLLQQLQLHVWGNLLEDLQSAAAIPRSELFATVQSTLLALPKLEQQGMVNQS